MSTLHHEGRTKRRLSASGTVRALRLTCQTKSKFHAYPSILMVCAPRYEFICDWTSLSSEQDEIFSRGSHTVASRLVQDVQLAPRLRAFTSCPACPIGSVCSYAIYFMMNAVDCPNASKSLNAFSKEYVRLAPSKSSWTNNRFQVLD